MVAPENVIGVPLGTRLMRIERLVGGWRLWTSTADYKLGTYLEMFNDGCIISVTVRDNEGDEVFVVRPQD
jgi:hypothetical protein